MDSREFPVVLGIQARRRSSREDPPKRGIEVHHYIFHLLDISGVCEVWQYRKEKNTPVYLQTGPEWPLLVVQGVAHSVYWYTTADVKDYWRQ